MFNDLNAPAHEVAPRLLGSYIERYVNDQRILVRIIEVEAYEQHDPASHSYRGETPRTRTMFGPSGHLYVYFTYGMHYCCNIVTQEGSAVLLRAAQVVEGAEAIAAYRPNVPEAQWLNGPAKLCKALGIDRTADGHDLRLKPIRLLLNPPISSSAIVQTTRVGISKAQNVPWRFYERNNSYVSRR